MANAVWIVPQLKDGKLSAVSREALAAGQALARATGAAAEAVLLGHDLAAACEEAAALDLAAVRTVDDEALGSYTPGAWVSALAGAIRGHAPALVLFPHTYQTVDYVPRLAADVDGALLPEAVAWRADDEGLVWTRPILGGKLFAEVRTHGDGPVLASLQAGAFSADELAAGSAPVEALDLGGVEIRPDREILGVEEVAGEHVDLSQAKVIVAVGRGIGGEEKMAVVRELAEVLGAEIGASRPVVDSGWLERDRQIGSSGQTVAPKLYVGVGISGAIQHLVGMKGSQTVVAINKDAGAPIFTVADYGLVGDLHEILPPLIAALREAGE